VSKPYGYVSDKEALVKRLHRIEGLAFQILEGHVESCVAGALSSGDAEVAADKSRELLEAVHRFSRTK
jgi:DNA-binding FrmR family transcriptional regulator